MRKGRQTIRDALSALDPAAATANAIVSLDLILRNGRTFKTDDVTVEKDGTVYARSAGDSDTWLHIEADEIIGYEAKIDRGLCVRAERSPALGAVLRYATKNLIQ